MSKVIINKDIIIKTFCDLQHELFLNEIYWLNKFSKYNFSPKILKIDYKKKSIHITNVGNKISKNNLPKNWVKQLNEILTILKNNNCFHGDIKPDNLMVQNNTLKLIDFAQSSKKIGKKISYIKKRMFFDEYSKNRVELDLNILNYQSNDLRTLIIWNRFNEKIIELELKKNKNFEILDKIFLSKNCYEDFFKDRIFWLENFYNRPFNKDSKKLTNNIICYILISKNPKFIEKKMLFSKDRRFVDNDIFEFKKKIRNKRKNIIHISDNFEEAKRNCFYLSRNKNSYPFKYFTKSQLNHSSFKNLIEKLNNNKKLKYIVIRNRKNKLDDIDILCNDYFLFKREVDGHSFKKRKTSFISNSGDPVEDYGFKVANFIKIKNKEICVDIRYLGDGYMDRNWQKKLLKNRVKNKIYYNLNLKDELTSLIYHVVYHKGFIDKKYFFTIKKFFKKKQINFKFLKQWINHFLEKNRYIISRPCDLTIPITYKMSLRDINDEINRIKNQIEKNNFSGANKMLINIIIFQKLNRLLNINFLLIILNNQIRYLKYHIKRIIFKRISRKFFGI